MKKLLLLVFALLLIPVLSSLAAARHAETTALLREKILSMNPPELLSFLLEEGLVLPEDFDVHITEMSEPFVYNKTPYILKGQLTIRIDDIAMNLPTDDVPDVCDL